MPGACSLPTPPRFRHEERRFSAAFRLAGKSPKSPASERRRSERAVSAPVPASRPPAGARKPRETRAARRDPPAGRSFAAYKGGVARGTGERKSLGPDPSGPVLYSPCWQKSLTSQLGPPLDFPASARVCRGVAVEVRGMDDGRFESLLPNSVLRMTPRDRVAEVCRILAAGLRARAAGRLPQEAVKLPTSRKAETGRRRRRWAGSRGV